MENLEDIYELSPMQQGMLFHTLYNPASNLYFEQTALTIRGALDPTAFKQAWQQVVHRHQILRTAFYWEELEKPLQVVHRQVALPWTDADWRGQADSAQTLDEFLQADQAMGFALEQAPLMRLALLRFADDGYYFVWSHHHLLLDGWSVPLLLDEVFTFYNRTRNGGGAQNLPSRPRPYRDYILWLQQQDKAEAEHYWRQTLAEVSAPTPLTALSFTRKTNGQPTHFAEHQVVLSPTITQQLQGLAREERLTLNTLVQGAWALLLSCYSREEQVVFGATVSGRPPALRGAESIVGLFINTLPVCTQVPAAEPLLPWLQTLQQAQVKREQYAYTPLVDIQNWSDLPRGTALFESIVVFENYPMDGALPTQEFTISDIRTFEHTNYPLTVEAIAGLPTQGETERTLSFKLKYDSTRFDAQAIVGMARHLQNLLTAIADNPHRQLVELPMISWEERTALLTKWQPVDITAPPMTIAPTLHEQFLVQVAQRPDAIAVIYETEQLTYRELNQRANQLAHTLQALGVGSETLVGLYLERSPALVIAVLGILKAGGAYLPLDTAYPQDRVDFMLRDAQAPVLLTQFSLADKFSDYTGHRLLLDQDWPRIAAASTAEPVSAATTDTLAYLIYTSGSTGKPKGVMVTHANVLRLFTATDAWYHFTAQDVWTLFHSIAFDFSVWELWGALLYGGRLVVVPYLVSRSPEAFYRLLVQEQVTVLNQTPSAFRQLMQVEEWIAQDLPGQLALRYVIFGGEALELASLRGWFQRHGDQQPQLVNMYGITETTVHVTYRPLTWADVESPGSVIGRPIPDLQLYILDAQLEPTPVGVAGELYVGGAGVSRGYLKRPDLNAERFIRHPFVGNSTTATQERLYKTGDLARYLPNGDIEYLGRIDHQVKIRGFRIELGEIEHAVAQHPTVREQMILVREDEPGHKRLVAYVVFQNGQAERVNELRAHLQQTLPEYMVPAAIVTLPALPLTPNGKIDRRALPVPEQQSTAMAANFIAPRTATEHALAAIWSTVLARSPIGIHDNFFGLGGDSILSIQILAKAREQHLNFTLEQLFTHQTIYELAQHISLEIVELPQTAPFSLISREDYRRLPSDNIEDAYPLTRLQSGMLFHSMNNSGLALYHNVNTFHLRAPFVETALRQALEELLANHSVLRTAFDMEHFSEPLQVVYRTVTVPLTVADLRQLTPTAQEAAIHLWFEEQKAIPFVWHEPPLLRFHVHHRTEQHFQLSWAEHHAIFDGWSMASLMTELLQRYLAALQQETFATTPIASTFRDYVALEQATLAAPAMHAYWAEQLSGAAITQLPRWPVSYRAGVASGELDIAIAPDVSTGLKTLAQKAGVPIKSVLLAAHLKVLSTLANQADVLTGLAWNGRLEEQDGERVLGLFLNTLPFRLNLAGGSWLEFVQATFAAERAMIPYRRYPYADLQKQFGPLFETAFNFTHFHIFEAVADVNGLKILDGHFFQRTNFTLLADFSLDLLTAQVLLTLTYDTDVLDAAQVALMGSYYANTLAAMAAQPEANYAGFSPLSVQERQQLLVDWNATTTRYPREESIHALFTQQANRTPAAPAVQLAQLGAAATQPAQLSYRTLNARANQLAHYLRAQGVGPETLVGICVERSLEMVVGLLAILKTGGAFVPLDPAYPQERLAFMIADTQMPLLLTQQRFLAHLRAGVKSVCLDSDTDHFAIYPTSDPAEPVRADQLAYIMYTSGSTGQPKGVCVTHRNVVRLVQNTNFAQLDAAQVFLQLAPISFDASTLEIWGALLNGAKLVVMPPQAPSLEELGQVLKEYQITTLWLTAGLFHLMVDEQLEALGSLRQLLAGGDVLSVPHVQKVRERLPNCALINGYGPTENTTFTCTFPIEQMRGFDHSVPIGRPIANTQVYLLDQQMQPVPVGVTADLYTSGDGVARGYHNRPELTTERFVTLTTDHWQLETGAQSPLRLYKTGDLARYLPDGNIEFLGRLDNQVKVRGYRIELGEIESVLGQLAAIREVVAVVREDQPRDKRIVAYLVPHKGQGDALAPEQLRAYLQEKVAPYMMPSAFVLLEALPLNPNGKVDRRALPDPDWMAGQIDDYVAPRTTAEETLAQIWAAVLHVEQVGVHDNYFMLGGDSILSIQIVTRARQAGIQISARQLFEQQTVAALVAVAGTVDEQAMRAMAEQGPIVGVLPLTPIQHWFFAQAQPVPQHFNQSALFAVPTDLSPELLAESVQQLLHHHDALRLRFVPQADSLYGIEQCNAAPDEETPFRVIDLAHVPPAAQPDALAEAAEALQASLDLRTGPLLRVALFTLGDRQHDRLLIIVHHLAVDGVSWRILCEDLESIYQQRSRGEAVQLPLKTTSFRTWAQRLNEAGPEMVADEHAYWQVAANASMRALPVDFTPEPAAVNQVADTTQWGVTLGRRETDALLHEATEAYHTQVNDLLLTALVQTFAAWTGEKTLLLDLEGHGREEIFADLDLTRTVGWFTTIYPVQLQLLADDPGGAIKAIKEQLRGVPRHGIGYGILRYLGAEALTQQPEVSFNYLGQFEAPTSGQLLQALRQEPSGALYSPQTSRPHLIDIVGMVVDGELRIDWIYNRRWHRATTIHKLADAFIDVLKTLIVHCQAADTGGWTPSDFPEADLDQDDLELLLSTIA